MKSEGHIELTKPFTGHEKADLASGWTLRQENWLLHARKMHPPLTTGQGELTLKACT